ncbi:hypothetical protein [uncultured Dialister sp.]|nr:hypothetical protein [uncultured Dialister sp.]
MSKTVSFRYEPHCCHGEWGNFSKQFPAAMNRNPITPSQETY